MNTLVVNDTHMKTQQTVELPQWKKDQRATSTKVKVIPSYAYAPRPKGLSKRDKHRAQVKANKK